MTAADWLIVAVVVLSMAGAAIQGFFAEALSMAGLVIGYIVAAWQYQRVADWFAPHLKSVWLGEIGGFFLIFFAVVILAGIIGQVAHWMIKKAGLTAIDRLLGGVLGLLRGALVVAVVLTSMAAFAPAARWLAGSELAPYFLVGGRAAIWLAPSELRNRFYQGLDYLRRAQSVNAERQTHPTSPSK